jgi:hypothetical protein
LAGQLDTGWWKICKRICKRTTQHSMARRITRQHCHRKNGEQEHSYYATRASMRIIELENRCTGNRTVGSKRVANDKARELRVDRKRSSVSAVKRQEVGGLGRRLLRASFDATRAFAAIAVVCAILRTFYSPFGNAGLDITRVHFDAGAGSIPAAEARFTVGVKHAGKSRH